jgi:hypothetical protein
MLGRQSPQNVIDSYRKKRPSLPVFLAIMSIILVILGLVIIIMGISGGGLKLNLFSKEPPAPSTMPPTPVMESL